MRERNKMFLWPVYFDSTKTRSQGRKVPKKLATPSPKLSDIQAAVEKMGLKCEIVEEAAHPRYPWRKTGYVAVPKKEDKNNLLQKIAGYLSNARP